MSATIPEWYPPLTPADDLNAQNDLANTLKTETGEGKVLPVLLGRCQVGGYLIAAHYANGTWTVAYAWGCMEVNSITQVWLNGAAPVAGVTQNDYTGTTTQTADPLLSAAISGYSDNLVISRPGGDVGVVYSVFQYTDTDYPSPPQAVAEIEGLKTNAGTYSNSPSRAIDYLISTAPIGPQETVDATSIGTVITDNAATVVTEERRQIGLVMDKPLPFGQWIKILCGYASCWANKRGDTWYFVSDRPRTQDAALTSDDWMDGSFSIQGPDPSRVPTQVELAYTDTTEDIWREQVVVEKLSGVDAGSVPRRVSRIKMPGVTRHTQATRECQERLNKLQKGLTVSFEAFDDHIVREMGEVIDITRGTHLTNQDFRIIAPPKKQFGRGVQIQATEYDASVYSNAEPAAPSFGDNQRFLGAGVVAASGSMALGINLDRVGATSGTSDGEASFYGVNPDGTPNSNKSIAPFFLWQGAKQTVPHTTADFSVLTALQAKKGFIAVDLDGGTPFTIGGTTPSDIAFVYRENGTWYYDDNTSTPIEFDPDTDGNFVAIAWLETSPSQGDLIAGGGLLNPTTLTTAAFPAATEGATAGTDLKNSNGDVIPDSVITNFDDASALEFNPSFSDWTGDNPAGWVEWFNDQYVSRAEVVDTTKTPLAGPYAVKMEPPGTVNVGLQRRSDVQAPAVDMEFSIDSVVVGSYDVYVESHVGGTGCGMLIDLLDASNYYWRKEIPLDTTKVGTWQRVYFKTSARSADYIGGGGTPANAFTGVRAYLMGSWTGGAGAGSFTGSHVQATLYFDNVRFAILDPNIENESQVWSDISGVAVEQSDVVAGALGRVAQASGAGPVSIDGTTWIEVETVDITLPSVVTDTEVLIDFIVDVVVTHGPGGSPPPEGYFTPMQLRLLDDDDVVVDTVNFDLYAYIIDSSAMILKADGARSYSYSYAVPTANLNASQVNTFKIQMREASALFDSVDAENFRLRALALHQVETN